MITTVQSYSLNNRDVAVDLRNIPELSGGSNSFLSTLVEGVVPPPSFYGAGKPLTDRISSLAATAKTLQLAKDYRTRIILFSLLETAFLVVVAAAAITSFLSGGVIGGFLAFAAAFIYIIFSIAIGTIARERIDNFEGRIDGRPLPPKTLRRFILFIVGGALVLPPYEAITRKARLTKVLPLQEASIKTALDDIRAKNSGILPKAYEFFRDNSVKLDKELDVRIRDIKTSLTILGMLPAKTPGGENELKFRVDLYKKAKKELQDVRDFYKQFDPAV